MISGLKNTGKQDKGDSMQDFKTIEIDGEFFQDPWEWLFEDTLQFAVDRLHYAMHEFGNELYKVLAPLMKSVSNALTTDK